MSETLNSPIKLKKCPFCRGQAYLFRKTFKNRTYGYYGNYEYYVGCNNHRCKVKPRTKEVDDIYDDKDIAIKTVIKFWNER